MIRIPPLSGQTHLNERKGENISLFSIGQLFLCIMWKVCVYSSPKRTDSFCYAQKAVLNRSSGVALSLYPYLIVFLAPSFESPTASSTPSSGGGWSTQHVNPMRTAAVFLVVSPHRLEQEAESDRHHPIPL